MNLIAFSTLSSPNWNLHETVQNAVAYGYTALELRGLQEQMDLPRAVPFLPENRAESLRLIKEAGLVVCCMDSSAVAGKGDTEQVKAYAELARDMECPYVRVFGGMLPEGVPLEEALAAKADSLREYARICQQAGVVVVLETHDDFSTGERCADLLRRVDHPAAMILWDMHHPYRQGEAPEVTYSHVAPYLRHTHVKDSLNGHYCLMGEGDIPLHQTLSLALDGGYTGAISVEWEKRWEPALADPEIALPQYARAIREYLNSRLSGC